MEKAYRKSVGLTHPRYDRFIRLILIVHIILFYFIGDYLYQTIMDELRGSNFFYQTNGDFWEMITIVSILFIIHQIPRFLIWAIEPIFKKK